MVNYYYNSDEDKDENTQFERKKAEKKWESESNVTRRQEKTFKDLLLHFSFSVIERDDGDDINLIDDWSRQLPHPFLC